VKSKDFLHLILTRWRAGNSYRSIERDLHCGRRLVSRTIKQYLRNGSLLPFKRRRVSRVATQGVRNYLSFVALECPGLLLKEYQIILQRDMEVRLSLSSICRILKELGITRKVVSIQAMEASILQQALYMARVKHFFLNQLVFLDEVHTDSRNYNRRYGRGIGRVRIRGVFVRGARYTSIGAMSVNGVVGHYTTLGSASGDEFYQFALLALIPRMNPFPGDRSILILDNGGTHSNNATLALFRVAGIRVMFLPPYSPELNPIEKLWSKLKSFLSREGELYKAQQFTPIHVISIGYEQITSADCRGWVEASGCYH